jgi:DNA polymerase-3 subunit chi
VLVCAPAAELAALDELLWTFDAQDFVPHVRMAGPGARLAARTPIWLAAQAEPPSVVADVRPRVLVNLGCPPPDEPEFYERIIEIVGTDPAQAQAGRIRWAHYLGWGVKPLHHGAA